MKDRLILGNILAFCPFILGVCLLALFPLLAEVVLAVGAVAVIYALSIRMIHSSKVEFMPILLFGIQLFLAAGLILLFTSIQGA